MNKKLMAVAVAGALAVPAVAFAQASSVQIYGRANLGLSNVEADGATNGVNMKSRNQVYDQGSRLGFRGTEDLGGGLKAVFQIESGVNIDNGSQTGADGAANASTGFLASRDSFGGIAGTWGQVTFGRQSVWWTNANDLTQAAYINVGMQYNTGSFGALLSSPSARTNNVAQYQTPIWGGFQATLAYSPQSETSGPGVNTDGKLWGATLLYQGGPLVAQLDYARKEVTSPAAGPQNVITGAKAGIGWRYMPDAIIGVNLIRLENKNNALLAGYNGASDRLRQNAWQLNWSHMFGNLQAIAQAGAQANASGCSIAGGCDNTGSKAYLVSAKYHLSKRTGVYVSYTQLKNESRQYNDYNGGNMGVAQRGALPAGADPRIFAVGVLHNF